MRIPSKIILGACAVITAGFTQTAFGATVVVPATADIWLAAQPSGAQAIGPFGTDTAPAYSPVEVSFSGTSITFSATGLTSVNDGSCFAGPAGGCYSDESGDSPSPWSSDYNGPASALVGIFTDGAPTLISENGGQGPSLVAGPDYQNSANLGPGVYSPALDQIFIIGTGSGETFNVPTGATGLFLGIADALGASGDNIGSLTVTTAPGVPEPSTWALALVGFGLVGSALRKRAQTTIACASLRQNT